MLIVLSMHRSGSSLMTGLLSENGFNAGDISEHVDPKDHNPKGFWELQKVVELNEKMIRTDRNNHLVPSLEPIEKLPLEITDELAALVKEIDKAGITILKDPRFCLTLQHWLPFLSEVKIVLLFRHPQEVAQSLHSRQNFPLVGGRALWEFYNACAINYCRELPHQLVSFTDLVTDTDQVIESIKSWYFDSPTTANVVTSEFLDPGLIHNRAEESIGTSLTVSQRALFETLINSNVSGFAEVSAECREILELLAEFVSMGFIPGSGRLIDEIGRQTEKNLIESREHVVVTRARLNWTQARLEAFRDITKRFLNTSGAKWLLRYYSILRRFKKTGHVNHINDMARQLELKYPGDSE